MLLFAKILEFAVKGGVFLTPFLVLIVSGSLFFPYITGKGFFFRILVEIVFGLWLALLILNPQKYLPRKNILFAAFSIFLLSLILAAIFGVNPYKSFWSNYERMEGLNLHLHLFAYFFVLISVFDRNAWRIFFHISIFTSLVISGYAYLENFNFIKTLSGGRVFSTIGNPIYLAGYLFIHFFILFFYFFKFFGTRIRFIYLAIFLFELPVFFLTETRGAFLGFVGALGLILFLKTFLSRNIKTKFVFGLGLFAIVLFPFLLISFKETYFIKSRPLLNRFASISLTENTVEARFMIWKMALKSWSQMPIFGWGQENFIAAFGKNYNPNLFDNEPWFDRTHNTPLQWLTEAGALGFLAYLFLLFAGIFSLKKLYREKTWNENQVILFAGFGFGYFIQGFFVFDSLATYFILIALLGFLYFEMESRKENKSATGPIWIKDSAIKLFLVFLAIGLGIFLAVFLNFKPIKQAKAIIHSLISVSRNEKPEIVSGKFQKALNIKSFGLTETREQLGTFLIQFSNNAAVLRQGHFSDLFDLAVAEFEKEKKRDPLSLRPSLILAKLSSVRSIAIQKDFEKAEIFYNQAIALGPTYPQGYLGLAEHYLFQNKTNEALLTGQKLFSVAGNSAELLKPISQIFAYSGNYDFVLKIVNRMAELGSWPSADNFYRYGLIALKQNRFKEAEKFLKISLKEARLSGDKETEIKSLLLLAEASAMLRNKEKALDYAKEALILKPELKPDIDRFIESLKNI